MNDKCLWRVSLRLTFLTILPIRYLGLEYGGEADGWGSGPADGSGLADGSIGPASEADRRTLPWV
ncbi:MULTISPECIES: hypothetical protein [unclassified Actinobaculum]|uniref:hypothetical protein n=1 Tax=unclassified Actinobaculum TaxID=2609299 RepID=UPI000D52905C|nr:MULTISPECIES: hypothetical protein [unclassified Actinobaculum]AWE42034.1 hypothetical protein DDD63_03845 [Actinobaculum sp. 313]RTE50584.1 hypothetical protein EKN07_00010 [Actinobaculum sp. 352]